MKTLEFEPTTEELFLAVSAFAIALSQNMPPELADRLAQGLRGLADQIGANDSPIVGTLVAQLADAVSLRPSPPKSH